MKVGFKAAQHMEGFLDPSVREARIKGAVKIIKYRENHLGETFDVIAYRGASGAITASIIAHLLKKPLMLVRKPEDTRGHSPYSLEGPKVVSRYLIVDDFMSSGVTYDAIREAVQKEHPKAVCIGMLEVAYAANAGRDKTYRFSNNHLGELERTSRLTEGYANETDVAWATREQPLPPKTVTKYVYVEKEKEKYRFDFGPEQKLLPASTTEPTKTKDALADIFDNMKTWFFPQALTEPSRVAYKPIRTWGSPMKWKMDLVSSRDKDYEQKTEKAPEAAVSATTTG